MSAAEERAPVAAPEPPQLIPEEQRHRAEAPDFPLIQAKAIARAKGVPFDAEKHMPKRRKSRLEVPPEHEEALGAILKRFMAKRRPSVDRPDTERSGWR
jgi:hypothetical protein